MNALLLQDPHDAHALARALSRLQDSPDLQQRLGERAVEFATQRTWVRVAQQHERLYADLQGIAA